MHRVEALWLRILGALLIVLGLTLFVAPYVSYTTRKHFRNTPVSVKREKTLVIPKPVAVLVISTGVLAILTSRNPQQ